MTPRWLQEAAKRRPQYVVRRLHPEDRVFLWGVAVGVALALLLGGLWLTW